ncbi:MAG: hypothetical protein MUE41_08160 [Gemmatimonadaceae bacterium]|jgi:hypothetical protein|nr:hypothetical protein [Gemmatimonadaceae bacterium]
MALLQNPGASPPTPPRGARAPSPAQEAAPAIAPPANAQELRALRARDRELREAIGDATEDRTGLAESLRPGEDGPAPSPAVSGGIEARIGVIDERILRLEGERDAIDRAIAQAPREVIALEDRVAGSDASVAAIARERGFDNGMAAGLPIGITLGMLLMLAIVAYRRARASRRAPAPGTPAATERATMQLTAAVEAMAIEVERIGESQRFLTQLLSDPRLARAPELVGRDLDPVRRREAHDTPH